MRLTHGVMVTLLILVQSFMVRIHMGQQMGKQVFIGFSIFILANQTIMRVIVFLLLFFAFLTDSANAQYPFKGKLLFSDDFTTSLDSNLWVAEIAPQPGSKVYTKDGKLFLDTKGGVTVGLNKKLKGNIRIKYTIIVLMDTCKNASVI
jgi:hypothetical protein